MMCKMVWRYQELERGKGKIWCMSCSRVSQTGHGVCHRDVTTAPHPPRRTHSSTSRLNCFCRLPRNSPIICRLRPLRCSRKCATPTGVSGTKPRSMRYWTPFSGFLGAGQETVSALAALVPQAFFPPPQALSVPQPALTHPRLQTPCPVPPRAFNTGNPELPRPCTKNGKTGPAIGAWPWELEHGPTCQFNTEPAPAVQLSAPLQVEAATPCCTSGRLAPPAQTCWPALRLPAHPATEDSL